MELVKFGGSDDPLEGSNVTLLCRTAMVTHHSQMTWSILESKTYFELDAANLPEGTKY